MPKLILKENGKFKAEVPAFDKSGDPTRDLGEFTAVWELTGLPGTITPDPENPFACTGELGDTAGDGTLTLTVSSPTTGVVLGKRSYDIGEKAGQVATLGDIQAEEIQ